MCRCPTYTPPDRLAHLHYLASFAEPLVASIGTTIGGIIVDEFVLLHRVRAVSLVWLIGSAVTDLLITGSLVWYLVRFWI